jgi:gamma-glutamyltranspeptidase/glutathione hydrolase
MNGVGGDNFWLMFDGAAGRVVALNGAGRAARAATLADYRARHGDVMPTRGGRAALTVPGAVSGWWEAHRYSRTALNSPMEWAALFERAIVFAREGIPVSPGQRRVTALATDLFSGAAAAEVQQTLWPLYHPDRLTTERFVQPELAVTLAGVADGGADAFYRGDLAHRITAAAARLGSPLSFDDFAGHQADWVVEALRVPYRGGEAVNLPPPTQGFAALAILAMLDGVDVTALGEAERVHLIVEATKLAFEDRDRYLADPTIVAVPVDRCLDPARLARRRGRISKMASASRSASSAAGDTIAIVAADAAGNAVSVIQSLYHEFGAGVVAGDTGVVLQNRGAFFSLDPTHPNCLAPGKRTAHTLIPSMYFRGGRPRFVYGTMGGDGQPQTQAALVTRLVDDGLGPQAAVEAPRWLYGRTWGEASKALRLEARFGGDVADDLAARGHDVKMVDAWSDLMGHAQVIALDADGLRGGSDPRADGAALGI